MQKSEAIINHFMRGVGVYFSAGRLFFPEERGFNENFRASHRVEFAGLWGVARLAAQCAGGMRQHTWVLATYGVCGF